MRSLPSRSLAVFALAVLITFLHTPGIVGAVSQSRALSPTNHEPIETPPYVNLLDNGDFSNGLTSWIPFATPDLDHIRASVVSGVLEFYKEPQHDGRANQAVVFQWSNAPLLAGAPVVATFDLGNSSDVRKRIAVLIHEDEFSDLHGCTFWLAPHSPMRTYTMRTHTTKAWHNATIAFYAATAWSAGGFYQVDNVTLMYDPAQPADRTVCEDPTTPAPPGGPDGPPLLVNGDLSAGLGPWGVFHSLVWQLVGGVFEFIWEVDAPALQDDWHPIPQFEPAPVLIQRTGEPVSAGEVLTAQLDLGNSSAVRKRVSVLIHDQDFDDLAACSFWLEPSTPLRTYTMRMHTTLDWSDASLSVYAATRGPETWIQVDNLDLRRTNGTPTVGKECIEAAVPSPAPERQATVTAGHRDAASGAPARPRVSPALRSLDVGGWRLADQAILRYLVPPDDRVLIIEVSTDGDTWHPVLDIQPSENWRAVTIDPSEITERVVYVRIVEG